MTVTELHPPIDPAYARRLVASVRRRRERREAIRAVVMVLTVAVGLMGAGLLFHHRADASLAEGGAYAMPAPAPTVTAAMTHLTSEPLVTEPVVSARKAFHPKPGVVAAQRPHSARSPSKAGSTVLPGVAHVKPAVRRATPVVAAKPSPTPKPTSLLSAAPRAAEPRATPTPYPTVNAKPTARGTTPATTKPSPTPSAGDDDGLVSNVVEGVDGIVKKVL